MVEPRFLRWQVWLADSDPPIWRRFQLSSQATLDGLHQVLQQVMGWENKHPYRFEIGGDRYAPNRDSSPEASRDAASVTLADLNFKLESRFTYLYDFSDGWLHLLTLEAILDADGASSTAHCLEGECACPPESCGGMWGYEELLEQIGSPDDSEDELADWLGDGFDPDYFDLQCVNQCLAALKLTH